MEVVQLYHCQLKAVRPSHALDSHLYSQAPGTHTLLFLPCNCLDFRNKVASLQLRFAKSPACWNMADVGTPLRRRLSPVAFSSAIPRIAWRHHCFRVECSFVTELIYSLKAESETLCV